jgi:hypothetical protein
MGQDKIVGKKHDQGKNRWDLVPFDALDNLVAVITHGADKYGDTNWRIVPDRTNRYFAAAMRHIAAWRMGELTDPESKLPHLAHAMCSLMFVMETDRENTIGGGGYRPPQTLPITDEALLKAFEASKRRVTKEFRLEEGQGHD